MGGIFPGEIRLMVYTHLTLRQFKINNYLSTCINYLFNGFPALFLESLFPNHVASYLSRYTAACAVPTPSDVDTRSILPYATTVILDSGLATTVIQS